MQTEEWIAKGGTKIRICDMKDDHLYHTICFLQRWCNQRRGARPFVDSVRPIFWLLLDEAEERKIINKCPLEQFENKAFKLHFKRREIDG